MIYRFAERKSAPIDERHLHLGQKRPDGKSIDVNSRYFLKDGKPWIPVMGEIHFSRLHADEWERELLKMKAGGITLISTYVIWIYHEEIEGEWNFSGDNDIRKFILLCRKHGLDVVLRVGPWSHGEVRNGGFPDWLLNKNIPLRTNHEEYLRYARKFYEQIARQVEGLFFKDGGNIVAVQLENELVNQADHLRTLKQIALENGLDAPIYTVTGWNSKYGAEIPEEEVVPVFGGYAEAPWTGHTKQLEPNSNYFFLAARNDSSIGTDLIDDSDDRTEHYRLPYERYPFATCELGGGIQVTHHRRPYIHGDDVAAVSMIKLGCGNNLPGYYMYHGGKNKIGRRSTLNESKATGYPNDYPIISYDFQTALGEYGQVRPQYRLFKVQHLFIQSFMESFARMEAVFPEHPITDRSDTQTLRYAMRTDGNSGFIFVSNYQRLTEMPVHNQVQFEVRTKKGIMQIPKNPFTVPKDAYFFIPFCMPVGNTELIYAQAQPLCRIGETYFFQEIPGIQPQYVFEEEEFSPDAGLESGFTYHGARIVTLTQEQALRLYRFGDELYISGGDLYASDGRLIIYRDGCCDLSYEHWKKGRWEHHALEAEEKQGYIAVREINHFEPAFMEELSYGNPKRLKFWTLEVKADQGWIDIFYVGDAAQLYVDGKLYGDDFYYGKPWRVKAEDLSGKTVILAVSELNDEIYLEIGKKSGLELIKTEYIPQYDAEIEA